MKKSIKWKITIAFVMVMVCLIGSILLFNTLFLENLYVNNKKEVIKRSYYALESGITNAYAEGYTLSDLFRRKKGSEGTYRESSIESFLRELQEVYGVSVVLADSDNNYYSLFQNSERLNRRMMDYIYKDGANSKDLKVLEKTDNYTIAINNHSVPNPEPMPRMFRDASDIECFGFLSDEETAFFINIPIESIKEPIDLFNRVLIVVSIVALILGSIIIYIVSSNFSKPILELANISKKMSRLEFENKYEGKRDDEIGVLGTSMNEMSSKLEKSIKELKNANYKLKQDLEKKEELDIMRQEFVANVSHELKTPISLIKGYAEGLETTEIVENIESRDYYISVIKDEADKMGAMVRELLSLSEIERGMDTVDFARINLRELIDGVSKSFELKLKEKEVDLSVDVDPDIYVWADGYKLEEVMRNYLSNAINHINDNKIIRISTEDRGSNVIRIKVYNSGIKLDSSEMNKIWEKFYKVDKAHTRSYGGTGLGLSIVKAIAKEHNTECGCNAIDAYGTSGMEFYFDINTN